MVNVQDQFSTTNNCGFNLSNFKPHFIREYFQDVVKDYERSFIGATASALFNKEQQHDLYFAIAKFQGSLGYALSTNDQAESSEPVIPEFVKTPALEDIYRLLTEANLKNQLLSPGHDLANSICLVQFKLVDRQGRQQLNTLSFLNLPIAAHTDSNVRTFTDILARLHTN